MGTINFVTVNNITQIELNEQRVCKTYKYCPARKKLFFFTKDECFMDLTWGFEYTKKEIERDQSYIISSDNIIYHRANIIIRFTHQEEHVIELFFDSTEEAKDWVYTFIVENSLEKKLIKIVK